MYKLYLKENYKRNYRISCSCYILSTLLTVNVTLPYKAINSASVNAVPFNFFVNVFVTFALPFSALMNFVLLVELLTDFVIVIFCDSEEAI